MSPIRKLVAPLRALTRRRKFEADMAEEIRLHLEERARQNIAGGMSAEEARLAALRRFGGVEQVKEIARAQRSIVWLEQLLQDMRYALRQFAKAPGFTAVIVLTLALGIGSTTAVFSVVNTLILNPLPGPASNRLMQFGERMLIRGKEHPAGLSRPTLQAVLGQSDLIADFTWHDSAQLERKGVDFATLHFGAFVAPNFFTVLSGRPLLGRTFLPDDAVSLDGRTPTEDGVIVLNHSWWQSDFGGSRDVIGTTVELGDRRFTIIGVMPAHFQYPHGGTHYWIPVHPPRPRPRTMESPNLRPIVRLREGVRASQFQAMLDAIAQNLLRDYPAGDRYYGDLWRRGFGGLQLWSRPLRAEFQDGREAEELRRTLFAFGAAIAFVLVIVCANVANLTLARTERRQQELAIRAALGAGRARLLRQLLTENLLLALLGGTAGLAVTFWAIRLLESFNRVPRIRPIELDVFVLGIAFTVSILSGLAFGLAPAMRAGSARISESLAHGGTASTGGTRTSRFHGALVIVQIASTMVLLAGGGLMLRSVMQLLRVDPGFDPQNVLMVSVTPNYTQSRQTGRDNYRPWRDAFYRDVHERLAALPGVEAVGILKAYTDRAFQIDESAGDVRLHFAGCGVDASDYFRTMRIALLAGRYLDTGDIGDNNAAVLVNESLANLCWPGGEAIGKKMRTTWSGEQRIYEVVGVVADVRPTRFDQAVHPTLYRPYQDFDWGLAGFTDEFVVRTQHAPAAVIPAIRRQLKAAAPGMRMPQIVVAREVLFESTRAQRTYRSYLVSFAGAGLVISVLGVYGVLAYSVARRQREIGIRIALGAARHDVITMVVGAGVRLIGLGIIAGIGGAYWLTGYLQKQLFEVSPGDPIVYVAATSVLAAAGLLACYFPARRAANVDPNVALRYE